MDRLTHAVKHSLPLLNIPRSFLGPLAIVGGLFVAKQLLDVSTWTWIHLLRRGDVKKYLDRAQDTWALVTGASDGIGRGFAQELASQGFNVILHGRDEAKLDKFRAELQVQYPKLKFELLVIDADDFAIAELEVAVAKIKQLNIRVLVNNVAGGGKNEKPVLQAFHERTVASIDGWFNVTARFPTHLTRQLLPSLIEKKSSLILNIGSGNSEMTVPYMALYSGLKSYNKVWSRCLSMELQADGNGHVEVIAIVVGRTATARSGLTSSLGLPSSRQMACSSLATTGSGRSEIAAYWVHASQVRLMELLPASLVQGQVLKLAKQMKQDEIDGKLFQ